MKQILFVTLLIIYTGIQTNDDSWNGGDDDDDSCDDAIVPFESQQIITMLL